MDISSLISGFKLANEDDERRKAIAIEYSHNLTSCSIPYPQFRDSLPPTLLNNRFGGASDDAYFTSVLSTLCATEDNLDPFLCAVLNKIALQLTFQTRFLAAGHPPDIFFLDGPPKLLPIAIINANQVAGLLFSEQKVEMPEWANKYPHITLQPEQLLARRADDLPDALNSLSRPIGCVASILPINEGSLYLPFRYKALAPFVTKYTSYLIAGPIVSILNAKAKLEAIHPEAVLQFRSYRIDHSEYDEEQALLLIERTQEIPNIELTNDVKNTTVNIVSLPVDNRPAMSTRPALDCRFVLAQDAAEFQLLEYSPMEPVAAKCANRIATTAPLTDENTTKMKFKADIYNHVIKVSEGMVLSSINTYLYVSPSGNVLFDMADNTESFAATELYRSGVTIEGVRHATLPAGPVIRVKGAIMPLFFTPNLHEWFSHFLIQCFPRVLILRDLHIDAKILVPKGLRRKQRDMLSMVGVSDDQLLEIPDNVAVQGDELIIPRVWPLMFSPYTAKIYDEIVDKCGAKPERSDRRLLISRSSRQEWRNMLTYDLIRHQLLKHHGFEEVFPERLSLAEEVKLFQEAAILVGAEGAGLYGACFSPPTMKAIILGDEDYVMPILATLASVRGFEINYIFGESFRSDHDLERRLTYGHANFVVDPVEVEKMIEAIVAE